MVRFSSLRKRARRTPAKKERRAVNFVCTAMEAKFCKRFLRARIAITACVTRSPTKLRILRVCEDAKYLRKKTNAGIGLARRGARVNLDAIRVDKPGKTPPNNLKERAAVMLRASAWAAVKVCGVNAVRDAALLHNKNALAFRCCVLRRATVRRKPK